MITRISCGRCEACNKELSESEMRLKGWNTGEELGLCRKCAYFVNTPDLIDDEAPPSDADVEDIENKDYRNLPLNIKQYFQNDEGGM